MDELEEFCARMLGDGDAGVAIARAAREAGGDDRIETLRHAVADCRAELASGAVIPAVATAPDRDGGGGLSQAVADELEAASGRLAPREHEALALRELLRLSHGQLADVSGIEPDAVAPLLANSRLALRSELRGTPIPTGGCAERELTLRIATLRQDGEPVAPANDDWFVEHLGVCATCGQAHTAMLEASVCYRGWRIRTTAPPAAA